MGLYAASGATPLVGICLLTGLDASLPNIVSAFTSLKLEAVINSRSLYLHVRRVMTALENAMFSLNDAEVFIEYSIQ